MARSKKSVSEAIKRINHLSGLTANPDEMTGLTPTIVSEIETVYQDLWDDYSWPTKRVDREITLNKGQRYYDWPEDLEVETFDKIWFDRSNNNWVDITRNQGITPEMYRAYAPGVESTEIYAWEIYGDDQFEVFPTPGANDVLKIQIRGYQVAPEISSVTDIIDLDFEMVCLQVAANIMETRDQKKAAGLQRRATARFEKMKLKATSKAPLSFVPVRKPPAFGNTKVIGIQGISNS